MRAPKRSNVINPLRPIQEKSQSDSYIWSYQVVLTGAKLVTVRIEINMDNGIVKREEKAIYLTAGTS